MSVPARLVTLLRAARRRSARSPGPAPARLVTNRSHTPSHLDEIGRGTTLAHLPRMRSLCLVVTLAGCGLSTDLERIYSIETWTLTY